MSAISITVNEGKPQADPRSEFLQKLYKAGGHAARGRVNACQFGCKEKDLDENGFCRHLVGFSPDGRNFEPMVKETRVDRITGLKVLTGRRITKPRMVQVDEIVEYDAERGVGIKMPVYKPEMEKVRKGDVLVRISSGYRVYRNVDNLVMQPTQRIDAREMSDEEKEEIIRRQVGDSAAPMVQVGSVQPTAPVDMKVVEEDDTE